MALKKLEDMNLIDDFLFEKVVTYPVIGEAVCRKILSVVLGRPIGKLNIVAQKVFTGLDSDLHGARLDVYINETKDGEEINACPDDIYDVEPDNNSSAKIPSQGGSGSTAPRWMRSFFRQAMIILN